MDTVPQETGSAPNNDPAAARHRGGWRQRLDAVAGALRAAQRQDLVQQIVVPLTELAVDADAGVHDPEVLGTLKAGVQEVRACLIDPVRQPPAEFVHRLTRARRASLEQPETDSWDDRVGNDLEGSLLAAEEEDVDGLLANLDDGPAPSSGPTGPAGDSLGTLKEPLVPKADGATSHVLMKGELHGGLLSDLIQMFAQNAETGVLVVKGEGMMGEIWFSEGAIVDAHCDEFVGEEGFYTLMNIEQGRFSYERGVSSAKTRIFRSAQHLIMETLRLQDERG